VCVCGAAASVLGCGDVSSGSCWLIVPSICCEARSEEGGREELADSASCGGGAWGGCSVGFGVGARVLRCCNVSYNSCWLIVLYLPCEGNCRRGSRSKQWWQCSEWVRAAWQLLLLLCPLGTAVVIGWLSILQ
jgi:hypothetical protein